MPRLSISVSDELTARLEPLKDQINVSQVCREALERRVDAFERVTILQGGKLDLEALTARLREDRALVEGKFQRLGRQNAVAWLSTGSYLEIKDVVNNHNGVDMSKYKLPKAAFRTMKRDMDEASMRCDGAHAVAYKGSWLDYVRALWATVADQVEVEEEAELEPVEVKE